MTNDVASHAGPPAIPPIRQQGNSPCRILVVDEDEDTRRLNVATLTDAGYQMDASSLTATDGPD
jgi:hypothetical protein